MILAPRCQLCIRSCLVSALRVNQSAELFYKLCWKANTGKMEYSLSVSRGIYYRELINVMLDGIIFYSCHLHFGNVGWIRRHLFSHNKKGISISHCGLVTSIWWVARNGETIEWRFIMYADISWSNKTHLYRLCRGLSYKPYWYGYYWID